MLESQDQDQHPGRSQQVLCKHCLLGTAHPTAREQSSWKVHRAMGRAVYRAGDRLMALGEMWGEAWMIPFQGKKECGGSWVHCRHEEGERKRDRETGGGEAPGGAASGRRTGKAEGWLLGQKQVTLTATWGPGPSCPPRHWGLLRVLLKEP